MEYFVRDFTKADYFTSRDLCKLIELIHPANDKLSFNSFSLSYAKILPHSSSIPHKLVKSTEIYIVLEGEATLHINNDKIDLKKGITVIIPASAEQFVINNSDSNLEFICIVTPPWSENDEIIL